jgi:hypothetical protein
MDEYPFWGGYGSDDDSIGEPLAPLLGLVERLRVEVTELQGEGLGEELEAKRERLRLAEATMELVQQRQEKTAQQDDDEGEDDKGHEEEAPPGDGALGAEDEESRAAQASVVHP